MISLEAWCFSFGHWHAGKTLPVKGPSKGTTAKVRRRRAVSPNARTGPSLPCCALPCPALHALHARCMPFLPAPTPAPTLLFISTTRPCNALPMRSGWQPAMPGLGVSNRRQLVR